MADTTPKIIPAEPEYIAEQRDPERFPFWHRLALGGILLISIFMNFFQLGKNGFGSYYPPAVRSMMDNWHNFFFASYDPGGYVTVDKPPVGFWFQVASAKLFGFSPFSILFPQALAGVLSVLLLYYLVRRHFGVVAGLLAALALALSPISIVTNRNITIDSTLALTLLVGAWAVLRAAETGQLRWLLLTAAIVGVGFNIKMLEAYLVVPAFGLLYLLAAPISLWKRVGHLVLATLLLLVVSFSWVMAVDLTPPSQRPYVDSTQNNSELTLAIGYNGIERLLGRFGGGPRTNTPTGANRTGNTGNPGAPFNPGTPTRTGTSSTNGNAGGNAARQRQRGFGGGGLFAIGNPGPLRLFTEPLGGQIVWLLPLALFGMLALAWQSRPRLQSDQKQQSLVLWGTWLLTMGIFFSVAGFFHQYYMTEMAPAIAALFGIGLVTLWQDFRRGGWKGWLLPVALIVTAAEQIYILASYPTWSQVLTPFLVILVLIAVGALIGSRITQRFDSKNSGKRFLLPALSVGVLALLLAPTVWATLPIVQSTQADTLVAGPTQQDGFGGGNFGGRGENANSNSILVRYLEANQGNTKFLVAVPSSMSADAIILATNKPVMALGGFSGSDPILTTAQLATLTTNGTVRFFLMNAPRTGQQGGRNGFGGFGQQSALTTWVSQHCGTVPTNLWQQSTSTSTSTGGGFFGPGGANQLYDCATSH
jgi:4-amino-4-deoxy-L-arabinose transferase-like glycosyltransferase